MLFISGLLSRNDEISKLNPVVTLRCMTQLVIMSSYSGRFQGVGPFFTGCSIHRSTICRQYCLWSHRPKCGAVWRCHIPFCSGFKGMPSFEWLKFKGGETKGNPQQLQEFPNHLCLLVNARNILEWPLLSVNLAAAKLQK